ncbi:hypothetical protein OsI_35165 [Oryza sativa Indica Group]|uniref:Uncharacterized protein n=1 Tax=Oryza sativa subsp. indica TaxID=39946 RepID=B8BJ61_ORYSI|nr:hypothetical protein OsI_35165 [Oryza sativa Indica Group]
MEEGLKVAEQWVVGLVEAGNLRAVMERARGGAAASGQGAAVSTTHAGGSGAGDGALQGGGAQG